MYPVSGLISSGSAKPCVFTRGVTRLAKKERTVRSKSGAASAGAWHQGVRIFSRAVVGVGNGHKHFLRALRL